MANEKTINNKMTLKKRDNRKRNDLLFIIAVLFIPMCHWLFFTVYGNVMMVVRSFTKTKLSGEWFFTFDNYKYVFNVLIGKTDTGYWSLTSLRNSLSILPLLVFIGLPLTFLCSYYIYKKYFGYKLFRITMMLSSIVAAVVFCQFWKLLMNNQVGIVNEILRKIGLGDKIPFEGWLGNKDTVWGNIYLFSIWTGVGGSTMLYFSSSMTRIPVSLFESADLDGATEMRKLVKIVLPLIWPIYCTLTITQLGVVFSWYLPSLLMTNGGPDGASATIGLIIISETKSMFNLGLVSCLGVYIAIIGGTCITLIKHFMTKLYEEVEY